MPCIEEREIRIVRRSDASFNRIAEPGAFIRFTPILNALLHPWLQPFRRRWIDVEHDGLHRIGDRCTWILLLETKTADEPPLDRLMLAAAEIDRSDGTQ